MILWKTEQEYISEMRLIAIIVGIDNSKGDRDSELTPRIFDAVDRDEDEFTELTGNEFSEFVIQKVMPYVQNNYNSSTDVNDNCIAGASSGGLEAFYIAIENPEKFGIAGVLSPAFLLFNDVHWNTYLAGIKDFESETMPDIYMYNGKGDFDIELYEDTIAMYDRLSNSERKYGGKVRMYEEEGAAHNEAYWRIVFAEMMSWFVAK